MRKGLLILGVFFAIATIGGFIQSNIPAAIAMLLLSIVSFWRASKPKTEIAWEIGGFFFTWIVSGGIIMIAKEGLYFPNPHIFIFGVVATIVCFYMCDKEPSRTQSGAKTNSNSTPQTSSMNVYSGSNSAPQKSSIVVPQTTTQKYNNESIFDRLKRLCNPVNFMEDKEKFEIANQIYSKLKGANPNINETAAEAEKLLKIQLIDNHQIQDLKNKLHPQNFINSEDDSYDGKKVSFAYELYSQIGDNITYSEYNKLITKAKPILDSYTAIRVDLGLVDLGLSVKWAKYNIGARKPEEQGDFFAWGEINPKLEYSWGTYNHGEIHRDEIYLTKYCNDSYYGYVDNKSTLNKNDDVAYKTLGGRWRIPTDNEWTELKENCTWTRITVNGVNGFEVKAHNGNSIFLPANVCCAQQEHEYDSCYWSSSMDDDYPILAWSICMRSCETKMIQSQRFLGFSVRAVLGEE